MSSPPQPLLDINPLSSAKENQVRKKQGQHQQAEYHVQWRKIMFPTALSITFLRQARTRCLKSLTQSPHLHPPETPHHHPHQYSPQSPVGRSLPL